MPAQLNIFLLLFGGLQGSVIIVVSCKEEIVFRRLYLFAALFRGDVAADHS